MVKIKFKTPYYDYNVTLIQVESDKDADAVCKYLAKIAMEMDKEDIDDVRERITGGYRNGGETNWDSRTKKIICIFYECLSDIDRANIYSHEKRHIEDRILQHCKVQDIEASAYFAGFLGERFYELWEKTIK